jgi:hypothetical protein
MFTSPRRAYEAEMAVKLLVQVSWHHGAPARLQRNDIALHVPDP